jgi:hypothetical protein
MMGHLSLLRASLHFKRKRLAKGGSAEIRKAQISNIFSFILVPESFTCAGKMGQLGPHQVHWRPMMSCSVAEIHKMPSQVAADEGLEATSKGKVNVTKLFAAPWHAALGTARPSCSRVKIPLQPQEGTNKS